MAPLPQLTEATIRRYTTAQSYQRGLDYYEQGVVLTVVRRGQQIQAEVEGSQYVPYQVRITFDASGITHALCSCSYDWGGWCKHKARAAYRAAGRESEWRTYLEELIRRHGRKYKLVPMLEALRR